MAERRELTLAHLSALRVSLYYCLDYVAPIPRKIEFIVNKYVIWLMVWFMVFNTNSYNISVISWRSVLLVEKTGVPEENDQPTISH